MVFHDPAAAYAAFAVAAGLLVITPGMDTALVLRTVSADGSRHGGFVALGTCCGVLIWATIVAAGLGALLAASQVMYAILRWVGAAYLLFVGGRMLVRPRREFRLGRVSPNTRGAPGGLTDAVTIRSASAVPHGYQSFARGLFTNLLNPKIGVFYVTFLPQFVPTHVRVPTFVISLGAVQAVEGALWFAFLLTVTRPVLYWLRKPAVVAGLDRVTGGVLVAFAANLALSDR